MWMQRLSSMELRHLCSWGLMHSPIHKCQAHLHLFVETKYVHWMVAKRSEILCAALVVIPRDTHVWGPFRIHEEYNQFFFMRYIGEEDSGCLPYVGVCLNNHTEMVKLQAMVGGWS